MKIIEISPYAEAATYIMEELSKELERITGGSGKTSVNPQDFMEPRALFVVAYDEEGKIIGCGGLRPMNEKFAEVKRMYAKCKAKGIGSEILSYLEAWAKKSGYSALRLETRLINAQAVDFYLRKGYKIIPNYGRYFNNVEAVCFEKYLS